MESNDMPEVTRDEPQPNVITNFDSAMDGSDSSQLSGAPLDREFHHYLVAEGGELLPFVASLNHILIDGSDQS